LLYKHLRHQGKPYRKRYGHPNNRTGIPNRIDIDQRSDAVNNREVFGHWEADTIIGKAHKGVIVTLDERISKLRLAYPLNSKHKDGVSAALSTLDAFVQFPVKNPLSIYLFVASACPYKKIYYNWQSGKSEKCTFCYPRIESSCYRWRWHFRCILQVCIIKGKWLVIIINFR
jgi:hypothetical protein